MRTHLAIAGSLVTASLASAAPITTGTLLDEMVDVDRLAGFPDPPFRVMQFSSYDRSSVAPYAPGWYANSDGFGGEPTPNFEAVLDPPNAQSTGRYLMLDVEGPGAIVRCWTAAINGEVAVYLDGQDTPLFRGSAQEFLGDTYRALAKLAGLDGADRPAFKQEESCYFPIPFARRCRVEWIGNARQIHFYHLEVRRYPAGTPVETFTPADLRTYGGQLDRTHLVLADPQGQLGGTNEGAAHPLAAEGLKPGQSAELCRLEGPGVVRRLALQLLAPDVGRAERQTVLRGYFDDAPQPQIEAPIGDFFGSGPLISLYDSLPMQMSADGRGVCRLPMPYRASARFEVVNLGDQEVRLTGEALTGAYEWREARSLHFHAKWRVDHGLIAEGGAGAFDLPYLCARGRGVLVGVAAFLTNPTGIPTSGGNWWGEGDEKVWVDDDRFPCFFGTGSEDYFNYAWSRPALFSHAYCAQPLDTGPDNRGFTVNTRWHILDAVPFQQSLSFFMELFHHSRTPDFSYARIAWFYAEPWTRDDHRPITPADVTQGLLLPDDWQPVAAGAAQGATFLQAEDALIATPPNVSIATDHQLWSAGKLVDWKPQDAGETLELRVAAPEAGRYMIVATCALTPRGGRVSVTVDGTSLEPTVDLFTDHQTMLRNFHFHGPEGKPVELAAGEHVLTFTAAGRNERSAGSDIGIDFVWLLPR